MTEKNIANIALRTEYRFNNKNNSQTAKKYSAKISDIPINGLIFNLKIGASFYI